MVYVNLDAEAGIVVCHLILIWNRVTATAAAALFFLRGWGRWGMLQQEAHRNNRLRRRQEAVRRVIWQSFQEGESKEQERKPEKEAEGKAQGFGLAMLGLRPSD